MIRPKKQTGESGGIFFAPNPVLFDCTSNNMYREHLFASNFVLSKKKRSDGAIVYFLLSKKETVIKSDFFENHLHSISRTAAAVYF